MKSPISCLAPLLFFAFLEVSSQQPALTTTEQALFDAIEAESFRIHLRQLTKEPHIAGTKANEAVRDYMAKTMKDAGFSVTLYPYDVYMSSVPGSSSVEITEPYRNVLYQFEQQLEEDPFIKHPELKKGWNAYSGSGKVTAEVVYANYGTKADFEMLKSLGVDVRGKIVIARYGGNFRGYKAKYAEAAGAAGLIIYTDPKDNGYTKGLVYPEGPYFNSSAIQRGSLLTEDFTGDPLTPFEPALPVNGKTKIKRKEVSETTLHTIPVLPLGYGPAQEIMQLMKGAPVPQEWQGGLPFTYRLNGGEALKVTLEVNQPNQLTRVYNVVGMLKGSEYPDEWVILGCHYDAWAFGATDPNSGTAMLLTLSEALGKMAKQGIKPKRSILIAHWDAEEHGVIGSTEWVEQLKTELGAKAVAYLNFDGGVSGKNFGAAASPSIKQLLINASEKVMYPKLNKPLLEVWKNGKETPAIGNLGGGSDHIAFYMHVGVPSLSGGTGGPTQYHSNYDSFTFYEKFVDPDFAMGPMVAKVAGLMALELADKKFVPYDVKRYAADLKGHFANATADVKKLDAGFSGFLKVDDALKALETSAAKLNEALIASEAKPLTKKQLIQINKELIALEKSFIVDEGMPYGSWYKSLYASSDPFSGYASWILPAIQYQIETNNLGSLPKWDTIYAEAINKLSDKMDKLNGLVSSF